MRSSLQSWLIYLRYHYLVEVMFTLSAIIFLITYLIVPDYPITSNLVHPPNPIIVTPNQLPQRPITADNAHQLVQLAQLKPTKTTIQDIQFNQAGTMLATVTGRDNSAIWLWEISNVDIQLKHGIIPAPTPLEKLFNNYPAISTINFTPDGTMLVSNSPYGGSYSPSYTGLWLWQITDGDVVDLNGKFTDWPYDIAFAPPNSSTYPTFATGGDNPRLWQLVNNKITFLQELVGHETDVGSVTFSADGQLLASAGVYQSFYEAGLYSVRVWRVVDGSAVAVFQTNRGGDIDSLAFSPDGSLLAAGVDGKIWVWDLTTHTLRYQQYGNAKDILFTPDGSLLIAGGWNKELYLWRVSDGELLYNFDNREFINSVAISPDGLWLASGGYDNMVRLWGIVDAK